MASFSLDNTRGKFCFMKMILVTALRNIFRNDCSYVYWHQIGKGYKPYILFLKYHQGAIEHNSAASKIRIIKFIVLFRSRSSIERYSFFSAQLTHEIQEVGALFVSLSKRIVTIFYLNNSSRDYCIFISRCLVAGRKT